jgi:membrane-bound lytic murein transglycosylase D
MVDHRSTRQIVVPRRTRSTHSFVFVLIAALLPVVLTACSSSVRTAARPAAPTPPPVVQAAPPVAAQAAPRPVEDPVVGLLALSDRQFKSGEKELELGHVAAAKQAFNQAIATLLESPYGARTEPRLREQFDRLVDRISAYEVKALAKGDGFTEKKYEPATIDELLAMSATITPPLPSRELKDIVQTDLRSNGHDIAIPLNGRVLSFIELFQGRLHDFLTDGLRRGSQYLPMIQNVFRAEGLPLDLAYVPLIESAFNPNALSKAKAKGVWQFMRGTGLENGLRQDWYIDERSDPEKATLAAAKYLNTLGGLFNGDWHLALASYNSGPGRLQKAMKSAKLDDFWKIADRPTLLPRETRDYVPMILAAIVIARNPAQYGFEFDPMPAHPFDLVTLTRPVDLRRVAEWAETTIDEIQYLNPELRRWTTPVADNAYALKVPQGKATVVQARLDESAAMELASLKYYTVRKGETLATIAKKLHVSRTDLADANYLKATAAVQAGQQLMVPLEATTLMAARTDRQVPPAESRATMVNNVVSAPSSVNSDRMKVIYQVKQGDTLASIARAFKTTVASIQSWNGIAGTQIKTGSRLTVYTIARAN